MTDWLIALECERHKHLRDYRRHINRGQYIRAEETWKAIGRIEAEIAKHRD